MGSESETNEIRIALVENERDYREMLAAWLSERFQVKCFSNGREFMELFTSFKPFNLIISDIHMPEMSGLELISAIRSDPRVSQVPTIAMTAHLFQTDRQTALAAGFDGFVSKMADLEEMGSHITSLLNRQKSPGC